MYDFCIVGGGIAGSSLAYQLAPEFDLCLIEKEGLDHVGRKPCPGAVRKSWLEGVPSPEELGAVTRRIGGMRISTSEKSLKVKLDGYVIDRHKFCKGLLEDAVGEGCELVRGRAQPRIKGKIDHVRAGRRKIKAEVYVDASGTSAVLRRRYRPSGPEEFALGCMETIDGEYGNGELDIRLLNHMETSWMFPAEHSTNVGYVAGGGARGLDLGERIELFKREMGLDRAKILDSGYALIPRHGPIRLVYDNLVAIGDAGGVVNPVTCGGIGPSVTVANMLAEGLKEGESLEAFEARYRRELGNKFEKLHYVNRVIREGWLPLWWAVRAYYGENALGKLIKQLLRL